MSTILVKNGSYRNQPVNGMIFNLVKGFQTGARGGYVTVQSDGYFGPDVPDVVRIRVDNIEDLEFTTESVVADRPVAVSAPVETDDQVMDRIEQRFDILDQMTKATIAGDVRAMIVVGPPGVGARSSMK